jgi:hypothetical protein
MDSILRVNGGVLPERTVFDAEYVRPNRPVVFAEAVPREQRSSLAELTAVLGEETMTNVFVSSTGRFLYFKRPAADTGSAPVSSVLASDAGVTLERHRMTFKCVESLTRDTVCVCMSVCVCSIVVPTHTRTGC